MSQSVQEVTADPIGTSYTDIGSPFSGADRINRVTATAQNDGDEPMDARLLGRHLSEGPGDWVKVGQQSNIPTDEPHTWSVKPEFDQYIIQVRATSTSVEATAYYRR